MEKIKWVFLLLLIFSSAKKGNAQNVTEEHSSLDYLLSIEDRESYSASERILEGERSLAMRDLGLYLTASYTRRYGDAFADFNPENFSREIYNIGIDWELLKNGLYEQRTRAKIKSLELELHTLTEIEFHRKRNYYYQFVLLAYIFDRARLELLEKRLHDLRKQYTHFNTLFSERYIEKEYLLELEKRIHEVELIRQSAKAGIASFEDIFEDRNESIQVKNLYGLPDAEVQAIDIERALVDMGERSYMDDIVDTREQILTREYALLSEIRLTAYADYYRQESFLGEIRDYSAVGVAVRIPLRIRRKQLRSYKTAKVEEFYEDLTFDVINREKEILSLYKEYSYKQKQIQNLSHSLELVEERLRVDRIIRNSVDYEFEEDIQVLNNDEVYAIKQERQDLKQQLFEILLKINLLLPQNNVIDYLSNRDETSFIGEEGRIAKSKNAVIVNASDTFISDAEFYARFFESKGISTVFIETKNVNEPFEKLLPVFNEIEIDSYVIIPVTSTEDINFDELRLFEDFVRKLGGKGVCLKVEFELNDRNIDQFNRFRLDAYVNGSVFPALIELRDPLLPSTNFSSTKRLPTFIEKDFAYVLSNVTEKTPFAITNPKAWVQKELESIK